MENVIDRAQAKQAYRTAEAVARGEQPNPGDALVDYYVPQWRKHLSDRAMQNLEVGDWVAQIDRLTAEDGAAAEEISLYGDTQKVAIQLVGTILEIDGDLVIVDVVADGHTTVERSQVLKIPAATGEAYKAAREHHQLERQDRQFIYAIAGEELELPKFDHNHLPSRQELAAEEKVAKSEKVN